MFFNNLDGFLTLRAIEIGYIFESNPLLNLYINEPLNCYFIKNTIVILSLYIFYRFDYSCLIKLTLMLFIFINIYHIILYLLWVYKI